MAAARTRRAENATWPLEGSLLAGVGGRHCAKVALMNYNCALITRLPTGWRKQQKIFLSSFLTFKNNVVLKEKGGIQGGIPCTGKNTWDAVRMRPG